MSTCQLGIKHTVEEYVKNKSYLKFNGSNFIEVVTSFTKKVSPENFFVVAKSVANKLNKNINSNINVGNVFYNGTKNNKRGIIIAPTTKQLNLLNARDAKERELAIQEWESEEHQRELAERVVELEEGNNLYFQKYAQVKEGVDFVFDQNPELANSVYEALGFEIPTTKLEGRKIVEGSLINFDIIEELASAERSNLPSSILIKKLLSGGYLPKINKTDIVLGGLEYGIWRPNLKKIEAQGGNKSILAKKVGHELLHSVTHNIIYSYQNLKGVVDFNDKYNKDSIKQGYIKPVSLTKSQIEALDNLVRIRNKVVSYIEQNKDKIQKQNRGFGAYDYFIRTNYTESETDLHEFISEVFTNPELISILKEIPTEGKKSNLFKDFVNAIAKILGFSNTSILEDIIAYSEEAFFTQPQITPQQKQQAQQLYSQYLDTIFPESKVKDIVYHHSDTKLTEFKKEFPEGYAAQKGVSPKAKFFLRQPLKEEFLSKRPYLGQYLINTVNPNIMPVNADRSAKRDSGIKEGIVEALENGQDGAIFDNIWDNRTWSDVLVVFEPEQIHILGSKQDIEGFRNFVGKGKVQQKPTPQQSTASPELLNKIKQILKNKGIRIENLVEYTKKTGLNIGGINAVADTIRNIIAIAHGKEDVALTEEFVHIATSAIEQSSPKLIEEMMSKINRFKIYNVVLNLYKNDKNYQLPNGKPDIRKIKKEAVDKLIAEVIINNSENKTEFPELLEEENITLVERWWNAIKDFFKGIYKASNLNIFEEAASQVMKGEFTSTASKQGEILFQKDNTNLNNAYNDIVEKSKNLILFPAENGKKRHYEYNGEEVAISVTEKTKKPIDRTPEQQRIDDQKAAWGTEGHNYIANELMVNFIDENGYKRETPLNNKINSPLSEKQMEVLRAFCVELMSTYNVPGTRFIIEGGVVNTRVKGMIAGTTDFVALVPNDSKEGFQMDILDWKFIDNIAEKKGDIHHKKAEQWNAQMNEYINIYAQSYSVKPQQIKKSRMIPFISTYEYGILGDKTSDLNLSSIQVGSLTNPDDTKLYTLAVPTLTEDTGNARVNQFIRALNSHWKKLYDRHTSEEKKESKIDELNRIRRAIRLLHVKMNFEPITGLIKTFLTNIDKSLLEFVGVDFSNLSKEDLSAKLKLLVEYKESAEKFLGVDEIYLSTLDEDNATDEELALLKRLRQYVGATKLRMDKILDIQKQVALQLGLKEGVVTEETKESLLSAELELGNMAKLFMERAMLPSKIINLAAKIWKVSKEVVNRNVVKQIDQLSKLLSPVEEEAVQKGVSAFSLIGEVRKGKNGEETLKLKRKVDVNFYKEINSAIQAKDKAVLIQNIDLAKYNELAEKTINQKIQDIENEQYSTDEEENTKLRDMNIKFVKDRFDINRSSFNGFSDNSFQYLLKQCLKVDEHLSEDYKNMSDNAKALWQFFSDLNLRGKKSGYIDKEGMSFFALVEGNASEKLGASANVFGELIDIAKDAYTVKINEELNYSKIDEETGEVKRNIPKFYTRTDKTVRQLSTDLNKVGTAWIQALLEYENRVNMESVLQTLVEVEKSKGSLMLDSKNNVIMEAGQAKVNENVNENVDVLKAFMDNSIYNIMESETSWGNVGIKEIAGKLQKDEEAKEKVVLSTKKVVGTMDTLVRVLGTGLKASLATANWVGHQFQSFITAGNFYTTSEYQKNNLKYTTGVGLSTEEKALLHLIIPLNEDVAMEKRRQIAKKQSLKKWLETWSFAELMLSPTSFLERKLQHVNAMSFNENSMVVDGKIVNIRQYVNKQAQSRYAKDENGNFILSSSERKAEERKIEEKIKELKETSSLVKIVKVENDEITIPGVNDEEIARYRLKIVDYGRKLSGQMSREDRAGFRQDSIIRSFMMFRTWVPPLVLQRTGRIRKNYETDEWEYGRTRVFLKVWSSLANYNILQMYDVIKGTDKGLAILDEMFEDKRREHLLKTGKELEITQEEFYDLVRKKLSEQMKELGVLFSVLGVVLLAKAAQPPEDATDAEKNRYKWWARVVNKISDEITFYYNPATFESITKGSIMPALGILTKAGQFISALGKETEGYVLDDEKMMKEAHPLKYGLNMIPGAYQFQTGVLPYVWPDWAKDLDIRVTTQSRKQ